MESADHRRGVRALRHQHGIPIEQLAWSPQCGVASSIMGNLLSEDEQFRKLDVMLETAAKVWGTAAA